MREDEDPVLDDCWYTSNYYNDRVEVLIGRLDTKVSYIHLWGCITLSLLAGTWRLGVPLPRFILQGLVTGQNHLRSRQWGNSI